MSSCGVFVFIGGMAVELRCVQHDSFSIDSERTRTLAAERGPVFLRVVPSRAGHGQHLTRIGAQAVAALVEILANPTPEAAQGQRSRNRGKVVEELLLDDKAAQPHE